MNKPEIVILGAGLMGRVAAYFFAHHPDGPLDVRLVEKDESALHAAAHWIASEHVQTMVADVGSDLDLANALAGTRVCLSCVPYFMNPHVARGAQRAAISMVDLGGNPQVTDIVLSMDMQNKRKKITFVPDTGLAPGLVSILAWELVHRFKQCEEVRLRVGGLPQEPTGPLKYAQFFSIHGLLNEYLEDARELRDGKVALVPCPAENETLTFAGFGTFEAFVTSGGTSTLPRTLMGKVQRLDYKTIRYPGHFDALCMLRDIGLTATAKFSFDGHEVSPRDMLARVLEASLPKNMPDIVLVLVTAKGDGGREEKIEMVVKQDDTRGITAMGQMTAFPAAAVALAILKGQVPPGAHPQETVISFAWMKEQMGKFGIAL